MAEKVRNTTLECIKNEVFPRKAPLSEGGMSREAVKPKVPMFKYFHVVYATGMNSEHKGMSVDETRHSTATLESGAFVLEYSRIYHLPGAPN